MNRNIDFRGDLYALDRVAFVALPGAAPTRVRFRFDGAGAPWRCDACGRNRTPTCPHSALVADQVIRDLLNNHEENNHG